MNLEINDNLIPGTVLDRKAMGNVTGMEFLNKIFYISDGIMLSQIKEISGIDGSYFNVMGLPVQRLYNELKQIP